MSMHEVVEVEVETTEPSAEAEAIAAAMSSEELAQLPGSAVQTLEDGTLVHLVPYDETTAPDQTLRDAATLILECAEPGSTSEAGDGPTLMQVDENTRIVVLSSASQITVIRDDSDPKKGFCTECRKTVEYKNRKRHLKLIHGVESSEKSPLTTKCIHPDCDRQFYMVKSMMKHLETDHDISVETKELYFRTWEEFLEWKTQEEDANFVFFSKRCGESIRGNKAISYFVCQRDGSQKPHRRKDYVPTARTSKKGRVRSDLTCPARIKAYRSCEGVKVIYTFSHNHSISASDTAHQPLSKNKLNKIRSLLQRGVNSDNIHATMISSAKTETAREPSHIVTKRRIDYIKKKLDKESRLSTEESKSVHLLVCQLMNDPVVLYACDYIYDTEGEIYGAQIHDPNKLFLILFQSVSQHGIMAKFASRLLILEAVGNSMENEGFHLVSLIVSDEFNHAYPVAHIITNNLESGLPMALAKLQERLPDLELSVVMTPGESVYLTALQATFGVTSTNMTFYSGRWETVRHWEKKIRSMVFSSTIRRDLSRMLTLILDEPDHNKFEVLVEVFVRDFASKADRFVRYFEKNFSPTRRSWANCYREFEQYGTDCSEFTRKLFSRLDWWLGERQASKRVDDLINLLVRIEHEWSGQRQSDFANYSSMIGVEDFSKHAFGVRIPDSRLNSVKLLNKESHIWFLKGDDEQTAFVVKLVNESCDYDFCWDRCSEDSCSGLCGHMYTCTCDDATGLCEHIHKVRIFCCDVEGSVQTLHLPIESENENAMLETQFVYEAVDDFGDDVEFVFVDDSNIQYVNDIEEIGEYAVEGSRFDVEGIKVGTTGPQIEGFSVEGETEHAAVS